MYILQLLHFVSDGQTVCVHCCVHCFKCPSLQDGKAIEHETAPSGAIYTVVDKPKRGSSKKGEPDVVPPGSGGVSHFMNVWLSVSR